MSANDKVILFLVLIGMAISFAGILAIVIEKYKRAEKEKAEDARLNEEEINQKILQMHDYGEFLNKELSEKQKEAMLMYEMLLEKEKKLASREAYSAHKNPAAARTPEKALQKEIADHSLRQGKPTREKSEELPQDLAARLPKRSAEVGENILTEKEETPISNHNEEIKELYSQGLSASDIARRLQIGKGQVELVIRLFCG